MSQIPSGVDSAALVRAMVQSTQKELPLPPVEQVDSKGAYDDVVFSLADLYNSGDAGYVKQINGGFELHYLALSSASAAILQVAFDSDQFIDFAPGQSFKGFFKSAFIRINPTLTGNSVGGFVPFSSSITPPYAQAFVKLRVVRKPSKHFSENSNVVRGLKYYYAPQTTTDATNVPTLATQGAPLVGVHSIKFALNNLTPGTITSGVLRIWIYDPGSTFGGGAWFPTDYTIQITSPVGGAHARFMTSEILATFGAHRVYFAAESLVLSAGASAEGFIITNGGNGNI